MIIIINRGEAETVVLISFVDLEITRFVFLQNGEASEFITVPVKHLGTREGRKEGSSI